MSLSILRNPLAPWLFADRDACVYDVQQVVMRLLNERNVLMHAFGPRSRMVLDRGLEALYEYNVHPDTLADGMLGVMDVVLLLDDQARRDGWRGPRANGETFCDWMLPRVSDLSLLAWLSTFEDWPSDIRAEVVASLRSRLVSVSALGLGELRAGVGAFGVGV